MFKKRYKVSRHAEFISASPGDFSHTIIVSFSLCNFVSLCLSGSKKVGSLTKILRATPYRRASVPARHDTSRTGFNFFTFYFLINFHWALSKIIYIHAYPDLYKISGFQRLVFKGTYEGLEEYSSRNMQLAKTVKLTAWISGKHTKPLNYESYCCILSIWFPGITGRSPGLA